MFVDSKKFKEAETKDNLAVYKNFTVEEVQEVEDLVLEFTISTGSVDRDADTINPNGWKLDAYNKNPVVLFAHDYNSPPVAVALATWVEDGKLKSRAKFTPKEVYPFGYMIYQLYKNGFMRAASVGFNPIKWKYSEDRDGGIDFLEQELLEWSCVPVPSNPEALVAASAKGIDIEPMKKWAKHILEYDKGAITYGRAHPDGTPLAPEDEPWDGQAEVAAASVDDLKVMCAWYDSDNPDIKSSYKLPHHRASGGHAVVWRGVAAAMAALMGGRGGVDIPEEDRKAVYNHLAKHYEEFGKTPPDYAMLDKKHAKLDAETTKTGAVLSKTNKEKLEQARDLIQEVLDTSERTDTDVEESINVDVIKELISEALKREIRKMQGKID